MEETTLLTEKFPFPEKEGDDDPWDFIFRPDERKEIVIKDVDDIKGLVVLESPMVRDILPLRHPLLAAFQPMWGFQEILTTC